MLHNILYKISCLIPTSKKPLAVSDDQSGLLRGDSGYRIVQRGRVRHHLKQVPFPNTKKTKAGAQILRVASLVLGLWLSHHRGDKNSSTGALKGSNVNHWWGKRPILVRSIAVTTVQKRDRYYTYKYVVRTGFEPVWCYLEYPLQSRMLVANNYS